MTNEENFAEYFKKNGEEILLNDTLVKGLICDFFSSDTAFKNVLNIVVQAGVVKKLCALKKNGVLDVEFEIAKITRVFIQENAIVESTAKNAVNCFAAVLFDKKPRRENTGQKPREAEATDDAEQQYLSGLEYYKANNYPKAFECFKEAAEQGHRDAQFELGLRYVKGEGVERDLGKGFEWYSKAAEQGHMEAQFKLGFRRAYGTGTYGSARVSNLLKAFEWFSKAAAQGHMEAQFQLGVLYERGEGVEKDLEKAFVWYSKAAEQGHKEAQIQVKNYVRRW